MKFILVFAALVALTAPAAAGIATTAWGGVNGKGVDLFTLTNARGMEVKVNHPFEPQLSLIRNAVTFSGTPVKEYRAPPLLGAHTGEVLADIGYDEAKVKELKERKVV